MRGKIAAACAAVLVGLAPPGALACASLSASWAAAANCGSDSAAVARFAHALAGAVPSLDVQASVLARAAVQCGPGQPARGIAPGPTRAIWRSPSGPAASQAPPPALLA